MTVHEDQTQTIVAVATAVAAGAGSIAVVRISGPLAENVGKQVVRTPGKQIWASHRIVYGHVMDAQNKERLDEVLVLIMKSPRSFTGEDIIEIHCHGGIMSVQRVLERTLACKGVRKALPGEFSQRAVMNGRLDLTQAEAIGDLIGARSKKAAQLAMAGLDGGIQQRINQLRDNLLNQLSEIEARVDFEDELPTLDKEKLLSELLNIQDKLKQLILDAKNAGYLRRGLKVALIGRPNVGKSSLLNRLSNQEKAIVTQIPGTTRDLLESEIILEGVPITLIDTAGIRTTSNEIERIGIDRSKKALQSADAIILVFDLSDGWTKDDEKILAHLPNDVPQLIVANKADIQHAQETRKTSSPNRVTNQTIIFSALTGKGQSTLIERLLMICGASGANSLIISLNERQSYLAQQAVDAINRIKKASEEKLPWDFWTIDLRDAIHCLGEITGEEVTESLLNRIFSKFCIGK